MLAALFDDNIMILMFMSVMLRCGLGAACPARCTTISPPPHCIATPHAPIITRGRQVLSMRCIPMARYSGQSHRGRPRQLAMPGYLGNAIRYYGRCLRKRRDAELSPIGSPTPQSVLPGRKSKESRDDTMLSDGMTSAADRRLSLVCKFERWHFIRYLIKTLARRECCALATMILIAVNTRRDTSSLPNATLPVHFAIYYCRM